MAKLFNIVVICAAIFSAVVAGNLRENAKLGERSYGTVGGWSPAPIDDPEVLQEAKYCAEHGLSTPYKTYRLVSASRQVVAGMKYDLLIQVTTKSGECSLNQFVVYDRFGDRTIMDHTVAPCNTSV